MIGYLRRTMLELRQHTSGNAVLLTALGLPVLIGGGGLAGDQEGRKQKAPAAATHQLLCHISHLGEFPRIASKRTALPNPMTQRK